MIAGVRETDMARLFVLMGKSASGKDTLYRCLFSDDGLKIKKVILYTTRPMRSGEQDGREYHFVDKQEFDRLYAAGLVIEYRRYNTVHGPWYYFTVADGQIDLAGGQDYLMIDTLEGYRQLTKYYGPDKVVPLYVEVEDGLRLSRALERERQQQQPKYAELCRRFLADAEDFSQEKLEAAGIVNRFQNNNFEQCFKELAAAIRGA